MFLVLLFSRLTFANGEITEPVTYAKVEGWLKSHPAKATLEALLPELPQSYRTFFTLMHETKSLQEATPDDPRVILFGLDAKLLMAFDGTAKNLELIEWQPKTKSFEFHEIEFPKQGSPHYSEPNPAKCVRCHGTDLRPNWEHYRQWPGAYGADDDSLQTTPAPLRAA
jgi:hypothetical protein